MKLALRISSLIGLILFGSVFAATFLSPIHFEQAGKEFIRDRIEAEVREKIGDLRLGSFAQAAGVLAQQLGGDARAVRRQLEDGLPEKVAAVAAQMLEMNSEERERVGRGVRRYFEAHITSLQQAENRLSALIQGKYMEIVRKLLRELRIFSGSNAVAFLCLLEASYSTKQREAQLSLPAGLLLIATLISTFLYLFTQNWFFTIIFNDYVGYGYAAYLAIFFLLLCDIVLNRAKITDAILHLIGGAISSLG